MDRVLRSPSRRHSLTHTLTVLPEISRPLSTRLGPGRIWTCHGLEILRSSHINTSLLSEHPHCVCTRVYPHSVYPCGQVPSPVRLRDGKLHGQPAHFSCLLKISFLPKTPASWRGQDNGGEGEQGVGCKSFFNRLVAVTLIMTMRFHFSFGREMRAADFKW